MKSRAIFLDRDGIINEMVYDTEFGIIHSPLLPEQVKLVYGINEFLLTAKKLGYLLIAISNQPNIGIKKMSERQFNNVDEKIKSELKKYGIVIDKEYYCLHHPFAQIKQYKKNCQCRKPNTLLFKKAINKFNINVKRSWVIGDGVFDIMAGNKIGAKTILLINIKEGAYLELLDNQLKHDRPTMTVKNLNEAAIIISKSS